MMGYLSLPRQQFLLSDHDSLLTIVMEFSSFGDHNMTHDFWNRLIYYDYITCTILLIINFKQIVFIPSSVRNNNLLRKPYKILIKSIKTA